MSGFYCSLLELDLRGIGDDGRIMRLTDAPFDVEFDGHLYTAYGTLLSIDKLTTENTLSSKELGITLSGIELGFQESVNNHLFRRRSIIIRKAYVPDNSNQVTDQKIYWRGFTSTPETDLDYNGGHMALRVTCKSIFDLDQTPNLMRSNNATHQFYHSGDKFFAYANQDMRDDVMWRES